MAEVASADVEFSISSCDPTAAGANNATSVSGTPFAVVRFVRLAGEEDGMTRRVCVLGLEAHDTPRTRDSHALRWGSR